MQIHQISSRIQHHCIHYHIHHGTKNMFWYPYLSGQSLLIWLCHLYFTDALLEVGVS